MSVKPAPYYKSPTGKQSVYYTVSWMVYGRNYQVKDLPIDKLTDIAYAFFNIDANGKVFSGDEWADYQNPYIGKGVEPQNTWNSPAEDLGNFGQFNKLMKAGKKFNLSLSIGGWTWSKDFSTAVSTDATRRNIVNSLIGIFQKWPNLFNGISWDWEYLSNDGVNYGNTGNVTRKEDPANFMELIKLCRTALPGFRHSLCVSSAPEKLAFDVWAVSSLLDEIHIMTYDHSDGNWGEKVTAHHTNPRKSSFGKWSAEQAADFFISKKVPSTKLFIGGANYSRGFSNTDGFGKPASGGSPDFQFPEEKGVVPYHMLPMPGATEYIDPECKGAYSYDPVKRVVNTYDNVDSIKEKCKIIYEKNLGGIIFWEASGDVRDFNSPRSLMRTVYENLTHKSGNITPVPNPAPGPGPSPSIGTFPCQFCSVCTKTKNVLCKARSPSVPTPTPAPNPSPSNVTQWTLDKNYKKGDIVEYNSKRYQCLLGHKSVKMWSPDLSKQLWQPLL